MTFKTVMASLIFIPAAAFAAPTTWSPPGHVTCRPIQIGNGQDAIVCGSEARPEQISDLSACTAEPGTVLQIDLRPITEGPGGGKPTFAPESGEILVQNIDWRVIGSPACLLNIVNPDQNPPPQPGTPGGPVSWPPAKPDVESVGTSI